MQVLYLSYPDSGRATAAATAAKREGLAVALLSLFLPAFPHLLLTLFLSLSSLSPLFDIKVQLNNSLSTPFLLSLSLRSHTRIPGSSARCMLLPPAAVARELLPAPASTTSGQRLRMCSSFVLLPSCLQPAMVRPLNSRVFRRQSVCVVRRTKKRIDTERETRQRRERRWMMRGLSHGLERRARVHARASVGAGGCSVCSSDDDGDGGNSLIQYALSLTQERQETRCSTVRSACVAVFEQRPIAGEAEAGKQAETGT